MDRELMTHPDRKLCEGYGVDSEYLLSTQEEFYNEGYGQGFLHGGAAMVLLLLIAALLLRVRFGD